MPTIKTDFVLSGERAYKQAVSEINSGLGVLNSEMKKVTAQYQDNANSVEALTAKGDVLERTLLSQKEKVEELREILAKAKQEYGEADKRTMEWEKSLNLAEAAVANTESAIRKNNDALEKARSGMDSAGASSGNLANKITDLASQFGVKLPAGLDKALGGMQGFSAGSVAAVGAVTAAVAGLVKTYQQLIDMTLKSAAAADEILTLSQITGLNTDTIQEMRYAANLIDVSFETIKGSMTKLKNAMQDARDGNEKMAAAFQTLRVEVTNADGSLRDAEGVFYDIIDALGGVENATERDTLAMDLFGKKAEDLNPLILQGSDRLRELQAEAHNTNYVLSGESLEALGKVDDAYQRLGLTQEALTNQLSGQMAPAVEDVHKVWADFVKEGGELLVQSGIVKGSGELLQTVIMLLEPITALIDLMTPAKEEFSGVYTVLHGIAMTIAWILDTAQAFIGVLTYITPTGRNLYNTAMGNNAAYGQYSHMQRIDGTAERYEEWRKYNTYDQSTGQWSSNYSGSEQTGNGWGADDYARYSWDDARGQWYDSVERRYIDGHASGTMHFVGGRTRVGENGPETVDLPEGSRIWNAQETRMGAGGGGVTIYGDVILDASNVEDFNDAVAFFRDMRVVKRMN